MVACQAGNDAILADNCGKGKTHWASAFRRGGLKSGSFHKASRLQDFLLLLQPLVGLRDAFFLSMRLSGSLEAARFAYYAEGASQHPQVVGDG